MHGWMQSQGQGTIHSCADSFLDLLLMPCLCWSTIDSKVPRRERKVGQLCDSAASRSGWLQEDARQFYEPVAVHAVPYMICQRGMKRYASASGERCGGRLEAATAGLASAPPAIRPSATVSAAPRNFSPILSLHLPSTSLPRPDAFSRAAAVAAAGSAGVRSSACPRNPEPARRPRAAAAACGQLRQEHRRQTAGAAEVGTAAWIG